MLDVAKLNSSCKSSLLNSANLHSLYSRATFLLQQSIVLILIGVLWKNPRRPIECNSFANRIGIVAKFDCSAVLSWLICNFVCKPLILRVLYDKIAGRFCDASQCNYKILKKFSRKFKLYLANCYLDITFAVENDRISAFSLMLFFLFLRRLGQVISLHNEEFVLNDWKNRWKHRNLEAEFWAI